MKRELSYLLVMGAVVFACGDNRHTGVPNGDASSPTDGTTPADAMPDACVPAAGRPSLASLTSGDLVIGATQSANTATITAPLDRSILFVSMNENEPSPKFGAAICELHDADVPTVGSPAGITCSRSDIGTDSTSSTGEVHIHWTVATFTSGVSVQRGEVDTTVLNPSVVSLSPPVDPVHSFVLMGGTLNGGTGWGNNEFVRSRLVDSSTLDIRTNVMGTRAAWQVVTIEGASVQRGTVDLSSTDLTKQVTTTVADPGSLVLMSYSADNSMGAAAAALMLRANLSSTTALTFNRTQAGFGLEVSWEVVTLPFEAHSGVTTFGASEKVKTETVIGVTPTTSVALASNQALLGQSSGSTEYAGADLDLLGEAAATFTLTAGGLTLERGTAESTASIPWTVVNFTSDHCAGF